MSKGFVWEEGGSWFVSGYASRYNNIDSHGDVIVKGAFAETINPDHRMKAGLPNIRFLVEHKHSGDPIGAITKIEETEKGLYFEAEILKTSKGLDALEEFKLGARDCFSVGMRSVSSERVNLLEAKRRGFDIGGWGKEVNIITKAELVEISAVLLPANTRARLGVKSMENDVEESGLVGKKVKFYDGGDDPISGVVVSEHTEPVETDAGEIEPTEGDPVLGIDLLIEGEDGFEQTGDIVYAHRSSVTVEEEEQEPEEEKIEEKAEKPKPRFIQPRKQAEQTEQKIEAKSAQLDDEESVGNMIAGQIESIKGLFADGIDNMSSKINSLEGEVNKIKGRQRPASDIVKANGVEKMSKKARSAVSDFFKNEGVVKAVSDYSGGNKVRTSKFKVKSFYGKSDIDLAVTTGQQSTLTGLSVDRSLGIIEPAETPLILRDLMNVVKTDKHSIEYVEESGFANLAAVIAATVASGSTTVRVDNARGFFAGQTVTLSQGKPSLEEDVVIDEVDVEGNVLTLVEGPANTHPAKALIFADKFVFTPETEIKPRAALGFNLKESAIKTLAHWVPASKQSLADLDSLQAYIERRLIAGLKQVEEYQILFGDGSSDQLLGIMVHPDIHEYKWEDGDPTDSKVDAIRRAITLASYSNYQADVAIISTKNWEEIEINKGTDGHYIQTDITSGLTKTLWGLKVFVTNSMPVDRALVGSFSLGATLWDREDATIQISDSHADFFTRNMIAILAEERIGLTVERPEAFVSVDLSTAPSAPEVEGDTTEP